MPIWQRDRARRPPAEFQKILDHSGIGMELLDGGAGAPRRGAGERVAVEELAGRRMPMPPAFARSRRTRTSWPCGKTPTPEFPSTGKPRPSTRSCNSERILPLTADRKEEYCCVAGHQTVTWPVILPKPRICCRGIPLRCLPILLDNVPCGRTMTILSTHAIITECPLASVIA